MEHWLETHRQSARFNLGESGHAARTVGHLVTLSGWDAAQASDYFLSQSLSDSPNWGRLDLRMQIAAMHPGACADNVLVTTGTSEALFLLFRALQPQKIALIVPAFQLLYEIPESLGCKIVPLNIEWDNASGAPIAPWQFWMNELRIHKPDTVVFNHPHNPTGLTFSETQIDELHMVCDEIGARLVGDEHYRFLTLEQSIDLPQLGPTLFKKKSNTFVTGSFVKCTGTPGLRIGWCLGPHEILQKLQSEKNYTTHTVSPLSEWLATIVLSDFSSKLWQQLRQDWNLNRLATERFFLTNRSKGFLGESPRGGLVCVVSQVAMQSKCIFEKIHCELLKNGLFLLPLESMECARWNLLPITQPLSKGLGFRLGLGCEPLHFENALSILEHTFATQDKIS